MKIDVLYEDNHCLVVNKPAGLLSQADVTGDPCLVSWARDYLKARYQKPGNVYVGLVHRLDRPTSGAMVLARTSKAASRLSDQFRSGKDLQRRTGPSSRDSLDLPRASGMTAWRRTTDSTGFACSKSQVETGSWPGCSIGS